MDRTVILLSLLEIFATVVAPVTHGGQEASPHHDESPYDEVDEAYRAIISGDNEVLTRLLSEGLSPNCLVSGPEGSAWTYSLLSLAIEHGFDVGMDTLLSRGASLEQRSGPLSEPPVTTAARLGRIAFADRLIDAGARIEAANKRGETPLIVASAHGQVTAVELLLDRGAYINATTHVLGISALQFAASYGESEIVALLLERGSNVHITSISGETALTEASKLYDDEQCVIVSQLLRAGASAYARVCPSGDVALHFAARSPQPCAVESLRLLVEGGCSVNVRNAAGETPLVVAIKDNKTEERNNIIKALLILGANTNIPDCTGRSPLYFAILMEDREVVEELLEHKADPFVIDGDGLTLEGRFAEGSPEQRELIQLVVRNRTS